MTSSKRRIKGEGAIYRRHDHPTCPPAEPDGLRPPHACKGRWAAAIDVPGQMGERRRRVVYGPTRGAVAKRLREAQCRVESGRAATDSAMPLGDYVETWIDSTLLVSARKPSTKTTYATLLRTKVMSDVIAATRLRDLKPRTVEQWLLRLQRSGPQGSAESSIRQAYGVLRMVLDTAVRDGLLATNPAHQVQRPRVKRQEARFLTAEELARLLTEAGRRTRFEPLLRFIARTGVRRGEALALRWADIDLERGVIQIRSTLSRAHGELVITEPKTPRSRRTLQVSEALGSMLKSVRSSQAQDRLKAGPLWQDHGLVFTSEIGTPVDPRNALRAVTIAAKAAGLAGVGVHTLRHTAATLMLEAGVPLHNVSEVLGHASVAVTGDIYGHVTTEGARSAMELLERALARGAEVRRTITEAAD